MTAEEPGAGRFGATRKEAPREAPDVEMQLQELVLNSRDIAAFLTDLAVVASARLSSPGNRIHTGVTIIRHKRPEAVAGSDAAARALDVLQNGFGDGPCRTALRIGAPLLVSDLSCEHRWAAYVKLAAEQGVSSILAVPLDLGGEAEAVMNLYSGRSNGFSDDDVSTVETFADQAAGSLRLVLRISHLSEDRTPSVMTTTSGKKDVVTCVDE